MFIWLVILINSLSLYTVVMWVNMGIRGTVVRNGKMQCIIHTVIQPLPTLDCQHRILKRVVLGSSNPHIAGVSSICGSCLTADPVTRRHYIVQMVLQFIRVPQPYLFSHSVSACPPRAHCCQPLLSLHLDSMGSQAGAHWGMCPSS